MRAVTGMVDEKYAWRRKELTAKREVPQEKKWAWFRLCHFERTDFYLPSFAPPMQNFVFASASVLALQRTCRLRFVASDLT